MKKIIITLSALFLCNLFIHAQVPSKFNYQAVVRNSSGELITNQSVQIQVSIIDNTPTGSSLYSEIHDKTTNNYGVINLVVGEGSDVSGSFADINWNQNDKYLNVEIDIGDGYVNLGTVQLLSVPYALHASSAEVLGSKGVYSTSSDTLFVVKDHQGNVVFAVFPDGAQVYVNEASKGKVGGFAVSGRSPSKADVDIFRITPDSARIYVNDTVNAKGKVGGFAVSGRSPSKGVSDNILYVAADSTRIYVNESTGVKGKVGGFAVSGRSPSKGKTVGYLQVTPDSTRIFVKDSIAGFGIANIDGGAAESFLNLNKQNYLIGHQTGSKTKGAYNSMIGYQAGFTNSTGSNNLFLGYRSGYQNVSGGNNVFIGTESGYVNKYTFQNTYVGYRSGYELSGASNTVLGSMAGENASGGNNTFIGTSAGRIATGGNNTFVGKGAGYGFPDENTGVRNTYIGQSAGSKTTTGSYNVMLGFNAGYLNYEGSRNTFLGYYAGNDIHAGSGNIFIGYEAGKSLDGLSDRLVIENSAADSTSAMFYGNMNDNHLRMNGNVGINYNAFDNYGLIVDVPEGQSSNYTLYIIGDALASGGIWTDSDVKYKKNISTLDGVVERIKGIRGVSYDWKKSEFPDEKFSQNRQIGFIAQEIELKFPELVKQDKDGNRAVNYSKFTPILVEAIKEQQNYIENLETKNKELENRIKRLEELILK